MAQFINSRENLVTQAIDGLIACSGGTLQRLDGYPHIKVVTRTDWDRANVALISGGGSGHEPSHAGFVGPGMLTAAVCGEVFASPSVEAVLAGILAVTGEAGCLLIVKNYTGDRLNFGLAAERARALGRKVEMVVVDDDIALPDLPQPRGVAGTLFVHKIAGALAEEGESLETVAAAARSVIEKVASLGTSLDTCTIPGSPKEDRIPEGKAELGLGIHGEPGVEHVPFEGAADAMKRILDKLSAMETSKNSVVLLNNLGSTTPLEMSILSHTLSESGIASHIIGPAPMMGPPAHKIIWVSAASRSAGTSGENETVDTMYFGMPMGRAEVTSSARSVPIVPPRTMMPSKAPSVCSLAASRLAPLAMICMAWFSSPLSIAA